MTRHGPSAQGSPRGIQVVHLPNGRFQESFITVPARNGEEPVRLMQRFYDYLADHPRLRIVRQDVFGVTNDPIHVHHRRAFRLDGAEWPVTWVEQGNGDGCPVAGIQVHAVSGIPVKPLRLDQHTVGAVFEDETARYCVLGGLRPGSAQESRSEQAWETLELMESALALAGMTFADVFRTWFYLDDILDWYDEFNEARNAFFQERKVYDGLVPASTGVGGSNSAGTALVADLLALQSKEPGVTRLAIPSPLQCPALRYGSSFNRAVEVTLPGQRRLYVSGTASIDLAGHTAHVGNVDGQVALTMEVVGAILRSREMSWTDVTRAIGYFKHAEDAPAFDRYCAQQRIPQMPVVIAKNDICRDDLLFEIEVDAARLLGASRD